MKKRAPTDMEKVRRILADMGLAFGDSYNPGRVSLMLALTLISRALGALLTDLEHRLESEQEPRRKAKGGRK